jgi:aspartate kinase
MARIVVKFGGTSVGDVGRIKNAALKVKAEVERGNQVDVVVSTGEQVTIGLMALALQQIGVKSRSWVAWQLPIRTDDAHGKARIQEIDTAEMSKAMEGGEVPIVPGFQGVSPEGRVTTLGRGGSDTSAVALAAALEAERCDIYTDVDGVYTSDPRIVDKAHKMDRVTYEEMLEMASLGSKVLQTRSVELAMNHHVRVQVLSSFASAIGSDLPGTMVVDEDEIMAQGIEKSVVSGIAYSRDEAKVTVTRVADRPGVAAAIFGPLAAANINVDMIVQNVSLDGSSTDITFTVPRADLARAVAGLEQAKAELKFAEVKSDTHVTKLSVIGVGMRSHAGVALKMFETLAAKGINIQVISTSEIKVSVLVASEYTELAVRALHTAYELDAA